MKQERQNKAGKTGTCEIPESFCFTLVHSVSPCLTLPFPHPALGESIIDNYCQLQFNLV
jgi:hypothetical protein